MEEIEEGKEKTQTQSEEWDFSQFTRLPGEYSAVSRLILRDLNRSTSTSVFTKYTKDQITTFLNSPEANESNLRNAVIYIYNVSCHFRRLIQYFASLSDLAYVVSPFKIDTSGQKPEKIRKNYYKTLNLLSSMDIKNQFGKILTVCLREDVMYLTMWVTTESIIFQQLPSDYCKIAVIENNVPNVSFDFSYFDVNSQYLDIYPPEFATKYKIYQSDRNMKWQELDSPTSFAIKCNNDILNYAIPPFSGLLREIYDLEDYKGLKLTKTEIENYALLVMKLAMNDQGEYMIDYNKATTIWKNLDSVLPEEIGSVLTPMPIDKISFEKSNTGDTDTIANAEQNLYTAAGVSSLIFNNSKASSNALLLSIKSDQAMTYGIVKSIEAAINRYLQSQSYSKNFKITFLDCSPFNRKEMGDAYLRACQFGLPMVSYYCASQGLNQAEMDTMNFLEDDVLGIKGRFIPLQSSSTQSSGEASAESKAGRPQKDAGELTEQGEQTREDA